MATQASPPTALPPAVLDQKQLATLLRIGEATVERHVRSGKIPLPRKLGRRNLWCYGEIQAWLLRAKPDGSLLPQSEWAPIWEQVIRTGRT